MTVTATPDEGYQLDTLTVTDSQGNRLKLTDQGGGKFTFIMPGSQVKVEASFVLIPRSRSPCPLPTWPKPPGTTTGCAMPTSMA